MATVLQIEKKSSRLSRAKLQGRPLVCGSSKEAPELAFIEISAEAISDALLDAVIEEVIVPGIIEQQMSH